MPVLDCMRATSDIGAASGWSFIASVPAWGPDGNLLRHSGAGMQRSCCVARPQHAPGAQTLMSNACPDAI